MKEMYVNDEDFKEIFEKCSIYAHRLFHLGEGFLYKGIQVYILKNRFRELLI